MPIDLRLAAIGGLTGCMGPKVSGAGLVGAATFVVTMVVQTRIGWRGGGPMRWHGLANGRRGLANAREDMATARDHADHAHAVDADAMPMRCPTLPHDRRSGRRAYYDGGRTIGHRAPSSAVYLGQHQGGRIGQSTGAKVPLSTVPLLSTGAVRCQTARIGAHYVPPRSLACTATTERPSALPRWRFP